MRTSFTTSLTSNPAWRGCPCLLLNAAPPDMHYSHQLQDRNIRLIKLELDTYRAPIKCRLFEASLDNLPEYEALSYVWGDSSKTEQITCDGQIHHVTTNAARALRRIRLGISPPKSDDEGVDGDIQHGSPKANPSLVTALETGVKRYRPGFLWIDAICIDQANGSERNHQVQLMREIYSKAQRVIVWLGDTKASGKTMSALTVMTNLLSSGFTLEDARSQDYGSITTSEIQSVMGRLEMWLAISAAFSSEWYTRVWCVQEFLLASSSLFLYRNAELNSEDLAKLSSWASDLIRTGILEQEQPELEDYARFAESVLAARSRFANAIANAFDPVAVLFLNKLHALVAKDPRDMFYGLTGLFETVVAEIDYSKPLCDVYRDSVVQTIADGLRVLSMVNHGPRHKHSSEWPSWVPDWRLGGTPAPLYAFRDVETSVSRRWLSRSNLLSARTHTLQLHGVLCDNIDTISEVLIKKHEREISPYRLRDILSDIIGDCWQDNPRLSTVLSWARTLLCGRPFGEKHAPLATETEHDVFLMSSFLACLISSQPFPGRILATLPDWLSHGDGAAYRTEMFLSAWQRRVFLTRKTWFGVGPECMQPGDVVAVFHGGFSPFVLRPVEDRPDYYWLVGECYVDELTHEGAYKMLEEGTVEERVFNLI